MKKNLLFLIVLFFLACRIYAQPVARNMVVLEISTGTWCTYCPGAANGADQLVSEGKNVAVVEYHDGDAYSNTASAARETYYNVTGVPDSWFDGIVHEAGGIACPSGNMYSYYLADYNQRIAVTSPLSIDISGSNVGNVYTVVLSIKKVSTITGTDLRAHLVLAEDNIAISPPWPGSSGCMNDINFVERAMVPDANGTPISFASGDMQIISLTFTKDAAWVGANCHLVAFVQDDPTKEIYNGAKVALNSLPAPLAVDFTGAPTSGCTPFPVSFTGTAAGATNYQWSCPGGTPSNSAVQNPSISYTTAGTRDVTFTAWNNATGRGNVKTKPAFINAVSAPDAPAMPAGNSGLCLNPPDQTYTITAVPNSTTYTWDLQPSAAGTVTGTTTSCTVNFDNAFNGTASLKVKGTNSCGDGSFSPVLTITVSTPPGIPGTPTGPTQLCMNTSNTIYTTTGTALATAYSWEILPSAAGTITGSGTAGTVDWAPMFTGPATIHVVGINQGCQGTTWSNSLSVNLNGAPSQYSVTGGGTFCAVGGTGMPVELSGSETGVTYTLYLNAAPTAVTLTGTGNTLNFGNQLAGGTYTIVGANLLGGCTNTMNGSVVINVDPQAPEAPAIPSGPVQVYSGTTPTTDYVTTGGTYATTYAWELTPTAAGTITGTNTTGTASWNTSYAGNAVVKVKGVNTCGGGSYSTDYTVNVEVGVGIPEVTGKKQVSIYPNPATDQVNIRSLIPGKVHLKVYTTQGKLVYDNSETDLTKVLRLDVSEFMKGLYFFDISGNSIQEVQKVVIQ